MRLPWHDEVKLFADAILERKKKYDFAIHDLNTELIKRLYNEGIPQTEIAKMLGKSRNTIRRWAEKGGLHD